MDIQVKQQGNDGLQFHLSNNSVSLVIETVTDGYIFLRHFGKKINQYNASNWAQFIDRAFSPGPYADNRCFSLDTQRQVYATSGMGDFRYPAIMISNEKDMGLDLRFQSYEIIEEIVKLTGLPSSHADKKAAKTLRLTLVDDVLAIHVKLFYTVFTDTSVIATHVEVTNNGTQPYVIEKIHSAMLDLEHSNYELIELAGAYAREKTFQKTPLKQGLMSVNSRRGASSHQATPFTCLATPTTNEEQGEVIGMHLVYSGDFEAGVFVDQLQKTRMFIGLNHETFHWNLAPKQTFTAPEALITYTNQGFGAMTRDMHHFVSNHILNGVYQKALRPILLNNWEATYFDFDESKILALADKAVEVGIELLVLDDGWFGKRDDDNSSLGDWFLHEKKLPKGLESLVEQVNEKGLQFGIWVEPEMISVDSELYRSHPDWCLHMANRDHLYSRNQLVLDLSRVDVQEYLIDAMSKVCTSANISYVKWDMNRNMTCVASALRQYGVKEISHRYMLGLYRILTSLTAKFPHILFESCSGGGGRYDLGMLAYMPQTWTSDNTDAVCRLQIQYGTSFIYPVITMGAHVSAVPNHQVGRITSLQTRGAIAMAGNLGYELDLTQLPQIELDEIEKQVQTYKAIRPIIQQGDLYRLLNPTTTPNETAFMYVDKDKTAAVITYCQVLAQAESPTVVLRLKGLDETASYIDMETKKSYGGDELMYVGLTIPLERTDFYAVTFHFEKC